MKEIIQSSFDHILTLLSKAKSIYVSLKKRLDSIWNKTIYLYTWTNRQINKYDIQSPYTIDINIDRQDNIKLGEIEVLKFYDTITNVPIVPYEFKNTTKDKYIGNDTYIWDSGLYLGNSAITNMVPEGSFMNDEGKWYSQSFNTTGLKIEKIEVS